jgi:cobaltochelatase CobT
MTKTDPVLGCLPLLADVLGRSYGVAVEIGGDDAFTDGWTIRLPALPATADPDFLGLVRGYIDHEAAHIRYTDLALLAAENPNPLEKHIWNSFEDWRVERELARLFPGCAANFRWLIQKMFLGQGDETTLFAVLDWLLYTVRSWAVPELIPDRDKLAERVKVLWPGLIPRIDPILEAMMISCPDSRACLDYARQVVVCIRDVAATTPRALPEEASKGGAPGKSQKTRKGKGTPKSSPIADSRDLRDLLAASEGQLPEDLGAELRRNLVEGIKTLGHGSAVAKVMEKPLHPLDPQAKREVDAVAAGLSARLHGLLQATKLVRVRPSRRGVLDPHRLYGIAVGEPKLFLSRQRKLGIDTTVHLLLDTSGSMRKRIDLAGQCCWAVAQAMIRSGIPVAITAFAGRPDPSNAASVTPILKPGQRVRELGMVDAIGNTPLGEALWWVLQRLVQRREERKLVIVITDGVPDDPVAAKEAIAAARRVGIEVYGIGILSHHLKPLMPETSIPIEGISELPAALFGLVGKAVLPGQRNTA